MPAAAVLERAVIGQRHAVRLLASSAVSLQHMQFQRAAAECSGKRYFRLDILVLCSVDHSLTAQSVELVTRYKDNWADTRRAE
jgi:hypothetical protein